MQMLDNHLQNVIAHLQNVHFKSGKRKKQECLCRNVLTFLEMPQIETKRCCLCLFDNMKFELI